MSNLDSGTEARLSLIKRREDMARQAFIDAVCMLHFFKKQQWSTDLDKYEMRRQLEGYQQTAQDAYNEVKELAILIGNASKAGYTAFWLREIKRLLTDCESEWSGQAATERQATADRAHDDLFGGL